MLKPKLARAFLPLLLVTACQGPSADPATDTDAAVATAAPDVVRTADATVRGYTEADFPQGNQVGEGVYVYSTLRAPEMGGTTNAMFVITDEGVLVADGLGGVEEVQAMLAEIAKLTPQPVKWVVVGSHHGDHRGGDSAFPADARFYATSVSADVLKASAASDRAANAPPVHLADQVVDDTLALTLGGREIQIMNLGRAHTGGDLAVYLPTERILYASEIFGNRVFPAMANSYPSEGIATMERAQAMNANYYIPGHGFIDPPPVMKEELEAYKQAWKTVFDETKRLHDQGLSAEDAAAQADFGDVNTWVGRDRQTPRNTPRIYEELDGTLR